MLRCAVALRCVMIHCAAICLIMLCRAVLPLAELCRTSYVLCCAEHAEMLPNLVKGCLEYVVQFGICMFTA